jgi:hypothetical protein
MRILWDFPDPVKGWQRVTHDDAVPRQGEAVYEGEEPYWVKHVVWYPFEGEGGNDKHVHVILRYGAPDS